MTDTVAQHTAHHTADHATGTFVDSSVFMGMHARAEDVRLACKNFFVERLGQSVVMSLEQVGRCDALVWRYSRAEQDDYYPFMDTLHTDMAIHRVAYSERDVAVALRTPDLSDLDFVDRLTVGMALSRDGELVTINPRLLDLPGLPVRAPRSADDTRFPAGLERLYARSLALRVAGEDL
ncbi:DUF6190 family protein [Actinophytocola sp.]|uniref:DUF6190 family protein n=1 Tax=Actinophytocola sp. TaxID=1872138 RepID=UPI003D6ACC43